MQHQESLVEPLNESTDENIDKNTYPVDIEDVTRIFPHPIKQGLSRDLAIAAIVSPKKVSLIPFFPVNTFCKVGY